MCEFIKLESRILGDITVEINCVKEGFDGVFRRNYSCLGRNFEERCSDIADEEEAFDTGVRNLKYLLPDCNVVASRKCAQICKK